MVTYNWSLKFTHKFRSIDYPHWVYNWFSERQLTGWWFQIFFIFNLTWGDDPIWLVFFRWVETTNYQKLRNFVTLLPKKPPQKIRWRPKEPEPCENPKQVCEPHDSCERHGVTWPQVKGGRGNLCWFQNHVFWSNYSNLTRPGPPKKLL